MLIIANVRGIRGDTDVRGRADRGAPADAVGSLQLWQFATYMFLHGGFGHILFNMLALWMFGTELERLWDSRFFLRYYVVCGVGGGTDDGRLHHAAGERRRPALGDDNDRRLGRGLRRVAGLRSVLSAPTDPHHTSSSRSRRSTS